MLTRNRYSISQVLVWSRFELYGFVLLVSLITILYSILDFKFLNLPWTPIALIGTAVAFMIGFLNNSAYDRIWEARKIWGGVVNASRSWGMKTKDMVNNQHARNPVSEEELKEIHKTLVFRHIAWLTAFRHAMRQRRKWEVNDQHLSNREWKNKIWIPELKQTIHEDLGHYLTDEERRYVLGKSNRPAALLYLQSKHLRELKDRGLIWEFSFLNLEDLLQELFTLQGKSERIKNFPYPRQYATIGYYFVWIFLLLLPFGIVPEFAKLGIEIGQHFPLLEHLFVWLAIPFCTIVSWVFHMMERIGRVGENPFEGSANDVPISTIARGIEIDLRQLLDEDPTTIPEQFPEHFDIQM